MAITIFLHSTNILQAKFVGWFHVTLNEIVLHSELYLKLCCASGNVLHSELCTDCQEFVSMKVLQSSRWATLPKKSCTAVSNKTVVHNFTIYNENLWSDTELITDLNEILRSCGRDLAEWLKRLTANVATVLDSIPASSDTVESEGRQMKQCWIAYIKIKNKIKPQFELIPCILNRSLTLGDGGPDDVAGAVLAFYDPRWQ